MTPSEWWKNFALGIEIDAAGTFIFNGIKALHDLPSFQYPVDSFEILYSVSIGIERLLKVAIILIEHDDKLGVEDLEKSLITHNTIDLVKRVERYRTLNLSAIHNEYLSLLSKFYKSDRYGRFSLNSIPNIYQEKEKLLSFLQKYLDIEVSQNQFIPVQNTNQIRKFLGRTTKHISDKIFRIVRDRAFELNIYTDELRGDSKALKVFYGERLDFIDEEIKKKEMLLFLMSFKSDGPHKQFMQAIEPLDMDPEEVPSYIQSILNDRCLWFHEEIVDVLYDDVDNKKNRIDLISLIGNEYLSFDSNDEVGPSS